MLTPRGVVGESPQQASLATLPGSADALKPADRRPMA